MVQRQTFHDRRIAVAMGKAVSRLPRADLGVQFSPTIRWDSSELLVSVFRSSREEIFLLSFSLNLRHLEFLLWKTEGFNISLPDYLLIF